MSYLLLCIKFESNYNITPHYAIIQDKNNKKSGQIFYFDTNIDRKGTECKIEINEPLD